MVLDTCIYNRHNVDLHWMLHKVNIQSSVTVTVKYIAVRLNSGQVWGYKSLFKYKKMIKLIKDKYT